MSGFPEKGADLRGSPGNFRGSLGQEWPRQTKPKKGQFMNFSQGHSGAKVQCESCLFSQGKTPEFTKMGEIHELFVLALSLVWFAGATPDWGTSGEVRETSGEPLDCCLVPQRENLRGSRRKTFGEVWGTSGEVRGLSRSLGESDSLPATRQICLQFWLVYQKATSLFFNLGTGSTALPPNLALHSACARTFA